MNTKLSTLLEEWSFSETGSEEIGYKGNEMKEADRNGKTNARNEGKKLYFGDEVKELCLG